MAQQRRRGEELKQGIFQVTLDLFEERGIEAITFQNVANLAKTSRSVLYRWWETPLDLLIEANRWFAQNQRESILDCIAKDSGSLKEDLTALCTFFLSMPKIYSSKFMGVVLFEMSQGNPKINDLINRAKKVNLEAMTLILTRARNRKEIAEDFSEELILLPFELMRYYLFLGKEMEREQIENLVENVFLPIYRKNM